MRLRSGPARAREGPACSLRVTPSAGCGRWFSGSTTAPSGAQLGLRQWRAQSSLFEFLAATGISGTPIPSWLRFPLVHMPKRVKDGFTHHAPHDTHTDDAILWQSPRLGRYLPFFIMPHGAYLSFPRTVGLRDWVVSHRANHPPAARGRQWISLPARSCDSACRHIVCVLGPSIGGPPLLHINRWRAWYPDQQHVPGT